MTKDELMKYDKEVLVSFMSSRYSGIGSIGLKECLDIIQESASSKKRYERRQKILDRQAEIHEEIKKLDTGKHFVKYATLVEEDQKLNKAFKRLLK
jgi:hypothetical protein